MLRYAQSLKCKRIGGRSVAVGQCYLPAFPEFMHSRLHSCGRGSSLRTFAASEQNTTFPASFPLRLQRHQLARSLFVRDLRVSCSVLRMTQCGDGQCAYFWMPGDHPYGAFSHWYVAETKDKLGNKFPTMEHYMMYQKAVLFGDETIATEILSLRTPKEVKEAGRRVHGFDKDKWKANREQIVFDGNLLKFTQHQNLQKLLLETGNRLLVEASPEDRIWGIGYSATDAPQHRKDWGENLCGQAIQKVRAKLEQ